MHLLVRIITLILGTQPDDYKDITGMKVNDKKVNWMDYLPF